MPPAHVAMPARIRRVRDRPIQEFRMPHPVLTALGLTDIESGTYLGNGEWSTTRDAGVLEPVNPTDGERAGARAGLVAGRLRHDRRARPGRLQGLAHDAGPAPRRSHPPVRRRAAHAQGRARLAGRAGDGQVQARRRRRSAGDDRHRRLRRRPVAPALRPDHAFRAPGPPHVRAVASAGHRRHHLRVQLPGRGVGVELRSSPPSAATSRSGSRRRRRRCRRSRR